MLHQRLEENGSAAYVEVDCAGTLHPGTVSYLGSHFGATAILGCPPQNCVHREGASLADLRILADRAPAVPGRIAQLPVRVFHCSIAEWPQIAGALDGATSPSSPGPARSIGRIARTARATGFERSILFERGRVVLVTTEQDALIAR